METTKSWLQVTKLMGHEPLTKWVVLFVVSLQLTTAYLFRHTSWSSPTLIACAYVIGGTANHNLFLAIHEITHNLAFKGVKANKFLAIFANLPIGIPYAATFKVISRSELMFRLVLIILFLKKYHIEHHKHLGEDGIDTDLPTHFELLCLNNVLGKTFFAYVLLSHHLAVPNIVF